MLLPKCGRKSLLLLGVLVMSVALASAGTLIRAADLEETLELNLGRTIAGYVVIGLVSLYISANTSTIAQVISTVCSSQSIICHVPYTEPLRTLFSLRSIQ